MYKSLEHLIREIKEGKCECEKKKDSLEGAIRKVVRKESSYAARDSKPVEEEIELDEDMEYIVKHKKTKKVVSTHDNFDEAKTNRDKVGTKEEYGIFKQRKSDALKNRNTVRNEDVGGLIGSGTGGEQKLHAESGKKKKVESEPEDTKLPRDYGESIEEMNVVTNTGAQMMGRQFNTRAAIIAPRKDADDGHGQAAKNVTIQRMAKIQKFSNKNVSDGGKIGEEVVSEAPVMIRPGLIRVAPPKLKPFAEPPSKIELPPLAPTEAPPKVATPKVEVPTEAPPKVATPKVEVPTEAPPKVAPPKVETKVETPPVKAPPKVDTKTETPTKVPTKVDTKTETPTSTKVTPKVDTPVKPAPKTGPTVPPGLPPETPTSGLPSKGRTPRMGGMMPYFGVPVQAGGAHIPVGTSVSRHRKISSVVKEESGTAVRKSIHDMPHKDDGDRHNIEYVGRKDAAPKTSSEKTSRQAQYKLKVIDEAKKLADVVKRVRKESGEGKTKVFDNVVINPDLNRPDNKNDADFKP